jgi:D-inositol-3-phosphate glycosyltransferase
VPLAGNELAAHVAAFGDYLAQRWQRKPPGLAHAYFWTSGLAALAAARGLDVPLVQTFGTLGATEWRHDGADARNGRIRLEACIARRARWAWVAVLPLGGLAVNSGRPGVCKWPGPLRPE